MAVLPDFFWNIIREKQHTVQTSSRMMQSKRRMDSGMIKINNSAEEFLLWFVWAGMTVEEAMSFIDDMFDTMWSKVKQPLVQGLHLTDQQI